MAREKCRAISSNSMALDAIDHRDTGRRKRREQQAFALPFTFLPRASSPGLARLPPAATGGQLSSTR